MAIKWTKGQSDAISAKNPVVVSAAAGSGKTAVLVERIIRKVMYDDMDIDRFLVVTFTEAAAGEMKDKIISALYAKLAENPQDRHIQRQILRVGSAHIETVHSFCLSVIKRYFHLADLPSKFRIADDNETVPLKNEIYDSLLEKWYTAESGNEVFAELVEQTSQSKNDDGLLAIIKEVVSKSESFPVPERFREFALEQMRLCAEGEILKSEAGKFLLGRVSQIQPAVDRAKNAIMLAPAAVSEKYSKWYNVLSGVNITDGMGYDEIYDALCGADFPNKPSARKTDEMYEEMCNVWKEAERAKNLITDVREVMYCGEKYVKQDAEKTYRLVKMLFDMANDFEAMYAAEKRKRGIADFADLEHFAIKILLAEDGGKTAAAKELSEEFDEIYIDEYQDTNEIQEKLFELVSRDKNIFCVGDIKQSIYRFRNANPSLFLRKLEKTPEYTEEGRSGKIYLADNFRSRNAVIDCVNSIFGHLMSRDVGDSDYGTGERLKFGAGYYEGDDSPVEFDLIVSEYGEECKPARVQAEHIARRIHDMLESKMPVTDKETGKLRPVRADDIAVMARGAKNFSLISAALENYGIPSSGQSKGDFFAREEVMTVSAMLKAIDNPTDEISLAATMTSPAFAFTADELVEIRLCLKNANFYDALCKKAGEGGAVSEKCALFLEKLSKLRRLAAEMPADRFLQKLYDETAYPAMVLAQAGGKQRRANLMYLITLAKSYEDGGFKGVFYFNLYLDSLKESGEKLAETDTEMKKDAVQIMTFHKSKGLEFPVVFLAYTEAKFSTVDSRKRLICDKELGVAMKVKDFETLADYSTAMREIIGQKTVYDQCSEEMRLLYVAMTRAKEKLFITASAAKKKNGGLSGLDKSEFSEKYSADSVRSATSPAQWLLSVLQHHENAEEYCKTAGIAFEPRISKTVPWKINVVYSRDIQREDTAPVLPQAEFDAGLYKEVAKRLDFEVQSNEAALPLKMPVSKIKAEAVDLKAVGAPKYTYNRPMFMQEGRTLEGAERGTALHLFMQFADYSRLDTAEGVHGEIKRLAEEKFITAEQAAACELDREKVTAFGNSEICARILKSENVVREKRFSIMLPAGDVAEYMGKAASEGEVFVQGIFDCVFFENGRPIIVDYKTDRVKNAEELKTRYAVQLEVYARAAEEIFGVKPICKIIYSLYGSQEILI